LEKSPTDGKFRGFNTAGLKSILPTPPNANDKSYSFGKELFDGDVIGVYVDLNEQTIKYSLNGSFSDPFGTAFSNIKFGEYVQVTIISDSLYNNVVCSVNLGQSPLRSSSQEQEEQEKQEEQELKKDHKIHDSTKQKQ